MILDSYDYQSESDRLFEEREAKKRFDGKVYLT